METTSISTLRENLNTQVAEFKSLKDRIADFKQRAKITPDLSTAAGTKEARSIRAEGVKLKGEIAKKRLAIGRECKQFNSGMIELENILVKEVVECYADIDSAIKAKEEAAKARAEEKQKAKEEAERVEAERVDVIQKRISAIRVTSVRAVSLTSSQVKEIIDNSVIPDESYQEFLPEAKEAFKENAQELDNIYDSKLSSEETERQQALRQKQLKAEQAELEAKRKADQEALAKQQADAKAKRDAEQAEMDEKNLKEAIEIAKRKAKLDEHEAKLTAELKAKHKADMERQDAKIKAERKLQADKSRNDEINIILDCQDEKNQVFVEIQDSNGDSIKIGNWLKKNDYNVINISAIELHNLSN